MKKQYLEIGAGKPIVLLHAFPLSAEMWTSQCEMLAQNGFRVILPDFPGFGKRVRTTRRYSIEEMAIEISELLDSLEIEKAIFGGLSMGGYVLASLLRHAPEKISGVVLCDTTFNADTVEKKDSRFALISKIEQQGSRALVENMLPNLISDFTKKNNPKLVEDLTEKFLKANPTAAINSLRSMAERIDNSEIAAQISVPALLVFGESDKVTDLENARTLDQLIPDSELIVIENAGHYSNLEQPEKFNQALITFCKRIEL